MKQISLTADYEGVRLSMDTILSRDTILKDKLAKVVDSEGAEKLKAMKEVTNVYLRKA